MLPRVREILAQTSGLSALKLILAAANSSRPFLRPFCLTLLRILSRNGRVTFRYRIAGKPLRGFLRLSHLDADFQSALELAMGDRYRLAQLPEPHLVIDGGANTGLFSLAAGARWPKARIVACEPFPENVWLISDHLKINGIFNSVETRDIALASATGTKTFYCRAANEGSFDPQVPYERTLKVRTARIVDLLKDREQEPVLIKLDIEGSEIEVLRDFFSHSNTQNSIVVLELHDTKINKPLIIDMATNAGFSIDFYEEGSSTAHCQLTAP